MSNQVTGIIVVNVEAGPVKGSRRFLAGNLGLLAVNGDKCSMEVNIDLTKLSD